jgi:peptidoglycan/LPS O-acetylase OafA/YrhL
LSAVLVEPPFIPPTQPVNIWTMSQRAGSVTYLTFAAGFSLAVYALFVVACDVGTMQIGLLRTLGVNALAGYILHDLVNEAIHPLAPRDSPLWYVLAATCASIAISYAMLRYLEKHRIFLKL